MNVIERFLRYVAYDSQSDETSETVPSTEKQKLLGTALAEELGAIGLQNAHMDEKGYVYAGCPPRRGARGYPVWASSPIWIPRRTRRAET